MHASVWHCARYRWHQLLNALASKCPVHDLIHWPDTLSDQACLRMTNLLESFFEHLRPLLGVTALRGLGATLQHCCKHW